MMFGKNEITKQQIEKLETESVKLHERMNKVNVGLTGLIKHVKGKKIPIWDIGSFKREGGLVGRIEKLENVIEKLIAPEVNVNVISNKISNKTKIEVEIGDHPSMVNDNEIKNLILKAIKNELDGSDLD